MLGVFITIIILVLINIIAYNQAYKFTHFVDGDVKNSCKTKKMSFLAALKALIFGVSSSKPNNQFIPKRPYKTIFLKSNCKLEAWLIGSTNFVGTIILFHGYMSTKLSLIEQAYFFNNLNYNVFLVDFMGSGGSEGKITTIGYKEADDVLSAYEYVIKNISDKNIILYGVSMGSVSIMRAIDKYKIKPEAIILECPFSTMRQTIKNRFELMRIPTIPFVDLLMLYGNIQLGFNTYKHLPLDYAKKIDMPVLLMYGEIDVKVKRYEIDLIYSNITAKKRLKIFKGTGHENYLAKHPDEWKNEVRIFFDEL